jgi:hypothetical protein
MNGLETWKHYGEWQPTARLRWGTNGRLEQVWERHYEERWDGGTVMGGRGVEEEWRQVPDAPREG